MMIKTFNLIFTLVSFSFCSFSQDLDKLNKKELREFSTKKIIDLDSLNYLINIQVAKISKEVELNKQFEFKLDSALNLLNIEKIKFQSVNSVNNNLKLKVDSLASLIENLKSELNKSQILNLKLHFKLDSMGIANNNHSFKSILAFFKQTPSLNANEERMHRDLTFIYPIGWSIDDRYFAYFSSFSSGATSFDFRIDQIDQVGQTKNVSLVDCEIDCDIDEFLITNNEKIKQTLESYGINKIQDTVLKKDNTLYKEKGISINFKKSIIGTFKDLNLLRNVPKIGNLNITLTKNMQTVYSCFLDLSKLDKSNFQSVGHIESPNKKYLLFFIEHWGANGYEGYPAVDMDLVSFPL